MKLADSYVDSDSSHGARLWMISYVVASLILCGGSVFGFTPLKQIFLDEGVFADVCSGPSVPCEAQLVQLDRLFTLAGSLFSVWLLPAGLCLRFLGPRVCFGSGFTLVFVGCLLFAFAPFDYYTAAYVLLGSGNPLIYIAAFNFAKLYPNSSNLLLSIFIGCFGFSSVVFYVFNEIHFRLGMSSQHLFLVFSAAPVLLFSIGMAILPPWPYHVQYQKKLLRKVHNSSIDERTPLRKVGVENALLEEPASEDQEVPLKEQSIPRQLVSAPFIGQSIFFCWGMLHQNFYLASLGDQIFMFANHDASQEALATLILQDFSMLYPLGCLLSILPVGVIVRNFSVSTSLFAYCVTNLVFSALALVPVVPVQWVTSFVYITVRVGFFTIMSTYSANIFGFKNLSAMFGCAGCLAGLCSLLGVFLSDRALYVDHSFWLVNSILLAGACLSFVLPILVRRLWEN